MESYPGFAGCEENLGFLVALILSMALASCVTSGKLLDLSGPLL